MGPLTRALVAIGFGVLVGTAVGLGCWLAGLAGNNWRTIPAWALAGALLGAAHPVAELLLRIALSLGERLDGRWGRRDGRTEGEREPCSPAAPGAEADRPREG